MKRKIITGTVALSLVLIAINAIPVQACELYGCSPGFWKQRRHWIYWPRYPKPRELVYDMFGEAAGGLGSYELVEALSFPGGPGVVGGARILLRAAVAAMLNAMVFGKIGPTNGGYAYSADEVFELVTEALESMDRDFMLSLATELDYYNNMGCPICD